GELVIVVPQIPLDACRFFERFVILADSEMLVSLAFVVIGEDGQMVGRFALRRIYFSLEYSQTM
ncbi:MAG: hypothetical protein WBL22_12265, partial [Candidatus Sulfotelmatobacter sp.]